MKKTEYPDSFSRKRAERQRKIRKRRIITFFIALIALLVIIGITLSLTIFFPIEKISAVGSNIYESNEIISISPVKTGDNIFAFSSKNLESEIRSKLPYIQSVKVERSLDGTVVLRVKDAKEKLCFQKGEEFFAVGDDGFVLNNYSQAPENLLLIAGVDAEITVGKFIDYQSDKKKEILETLLSYSEKPLMNKIDITDEYSILLEVENRFEVTLGTSNNLPEKIAHLNSMVKKIGEEKSGKINLSHWSSGKPEGTFVENEKK